MADIVSDISIIQDEDQLRRMWSNTEDFAKKKEIRVRLYKLRESRLKNYYTNDDTSNVSSINTSSSNIIQETNRKHTATKTHTDSIQDQGYMSLKSKEIRKPTESTRPPRPTPTQSRIRDT
ncbi:uncharacterized protein LOC103505283 [Diaphorina citri]|uniref:Uncharacterized protein LOC103505283 n=1 Tax=Diaphorina citri TaxID=121845 RepID=A0A1S3CU39_DIACI|nr:uncharacterized protein LOC103505283 [Diaphorina citri]